MSCFVSEPAEILVLLAAPLVLPQVSRYACRRHCFLFLVVLLVFRGRGRQVEVVDGVGFVEIISSCTAASAVIVFEEHLVPVEVELVLVSRAERVLVRVEAARVEPRLRAVKLLLGRDLFGAVLGRLAGADVLWLAHPSLRLYCSALWSECKLARVEASSTRTLVIEPICNHLITTLELPT
jgi:hypothetical protein